jgi:2-oxoglutarate ferredoxin oxidoreductase subunit alpha
MYNRDRQPTVDWVNQRFGKLPNIAAANIAALNAGHAYGETVELPSGVEAYIVPRAKVVPGTYRAVTGTEAAAAWGLVAGAKKAGAGTVPRLLPDHAGLRPVAYADKS